MKRFVLEQSTKEYYSSHSGLALVGLALNRFTDISGIGRKGLGISDADVLKSYLGLLALGKSDYAAITDKRDENHFRMSLDIGQVPSEETLRQRLDKLAKRFLKEVRSSVVDFVRRSRATVSALDTGHVPLDMDGFASDNSGTCKEGVSRTYRDFDGYMVMPAYLGCEGWCLAAELRPGSQHGQKDFPAFLDRVIKDARRITDKPLLVRCDSAHDAVETRVSLTKHKDVSWIIKWNPRRANTSVLEHLAFDQGRVKELRPGKQVAVARYVERETLTLGTKSLAYHGFSGHQSCWFEERGKIKCVG